MLLILTRMGRRIARHQPALRVIEGGRTQLIDEVARVAENLRELERALVAAREELRRLVLVAKPDRPSGRQGKGWFEVSRRSDRRPRPEGYEVSAFCGPSSAV